MSLRPLSELIAEVAAGLDGARGRQLAQVLPAALRVSCYLARHRPSLLNQLVDEEKIEEADFFTLLGYLGISTDRYEGIY